MTANRRSVVFVCLLALCLAGAPSAFAQTQTGNINGTVEDPNGDALAGVTVTVSGPMVMGSKTSVTSASGTFRFPALLPDEGYVVTFDLDGFRRVVREGVRVSIGLTMTLTVSMELSEVAAEITVTGETPMVDTTSATVSTNYGSDMLENIPNGRRFQDMVSQAPSMVNAGSAGGGQMWVVKGGAATSNEIALDGVANSNPIYHTSDQEIVYEAVEEVQVLTGGLPAEIGNTGGSYINVVSKSGGNEFRGEVAYYYQNDSMQSDNLTDDLRDQGLDTSPELTNFEDYSFNIGGPIKRDKLWFNVGFRNYDTGVAVSGFPFDNDFAREYSIAKLTWQPSGQHNVYVLYNRNETDQPYTPANQFYTPEATWHGWNEDVIAKAKWTGIVSENAFFEVDVGTAILDGHIWPQDDAGHSYYELTTTSWSGGAFIYQDNKTQRNQAKGSLTWFKDDWGGSHGFKFGLEYEKSDWDGNNFKDFSPIYYHITIAGTAFPGLVAIASYPSETINRVEGLHLYAQDTWRVSDRVTLNLGVRVNSWDGSFPAQGRDAVTYGAVNLPAVDIDSTTVFDWTSVDPRLGATIALDDAGKSVLRIGLSRYNHGIMMGYMILANPNALSSATHLWYDLNGDFFADTNEVIGAAISVTGGADVDPNTDNPYTDEVAIGFERQLGTDFSLRLTATWRKDADAIDVLNPEETPESFVPIQVLDPGPDSTPGTEDDRMVTAFYQIDNLASQQLVTNVDLAEREYKGIELIGTKRLSGNWQALGSIVWQRSTGTIGPNFNASKGWSYAFDDPNKLVNREGPLNLDREWQVKLSGSYLAPLGFSFSGYWTYQTGTPLVRLMPLSLPSVTYLVLDPRDSHRDDDISSLDLRAEKVFSLGSRPVELGLILDVFNVFNENAVARNGNTLTGFGDPLAIQAPRVMRLGARVRF